MYISPSVPERRAALGYYFLPCDRNQLYLLPPALQDWLPESDLAWFFLDAVAQMDLAAIERAYRAEGWGYWTILELTE